MHLARSCAQAFAARFAIAVVGALATPDSRAQESAQVEQPKVLWKYTPPAGAAACDFTNVLVRDGTVYALAYTGDRSVVLHAIDAATGERRWQTKEKMSYLRSLGMALSVSPRVDALFVGNDTGLFAFERATGKQLWFTPIASGVAGPACTDTVVVAGGSDGKVYGFDLANGRVLWQHDYLEDRPDDPPNFSGADARFAGLAARPGSAATDGKIVALSIFDQCRTLALDAASGKRLWDFRTQGWMYGRPAFGPLHVFVGSQDDHVYAVDKETGKLAWTVPTGSRVEAGAAAVERFVYFGSCDGVLYAVDHGVGRVVWQVPTETRDGKPTPFYSAPLVRGDVVYFAALTGTLYAVDHKTKKLRWQFEPLAKSQLSGDLATAGDVLFVATARSDNGGEGAVIALKLP